MTPKELNRKLVDKFPSLERSYREQTEWQEGDDTGSHVVYGDVLVPVVTMLIKSGNYQAAKRYFDYFEDILSLDDEYATDVIATTVIESLFFDVGDKAKIKELLGERCLSVWEEFEG